MIAIEVKFHSTGAASHDNPHKRPRWSGGSAPWRLPASAEWQPTIHHSMRTAASRLGEFTGSAPAAAGFSFRLSGLCHDPPHKKKGGASAHRACTGNCTSSHRLRDYFGKLAGREPRQAEEDRYRLLARNMTDVITRHGKNRAIAVHLAGGRAVVWRRRAGTCGAWPVRSRACCRPAGLSHALADSATLRREPLG